MQRHYIMLTALAVATGLACSDAATGPDGSGDGYVEAFVVDDPTASSHAGEPSHAGASEGSSFAGTISGNMSVQISADGQIWYDLGSPNGITVHAQSVLNRTSVHGQVTVPAGTYAHVRLVISDAEATIKAGAIIGGLTLTSDVDVSLAGGRQIVIEREVGVFTVSASAHVRTIIEFDLNTELWLTHANVEEEEVPEEDVEPAPDARTYPEEIMH